MIALHLMKTSEGGVWAARQASELSRMGVDVHVALPDMRGEAVDLWTSSGAKIHEVDLRFPHKEFWTWPLIRGKFNRLVAKIAPDVIHSHFVSTTLTMRLARLSSCRVPMIFQVPGPLHMEQPFFRVLDRITASTNDYWIASSRYTKRLYEASGIGPNRLFLSYYGTDIKRLIGDEQGPAGFELGIEGNTKVVGNLSYMYPPKYYLAQFKGIKGHEDVIDAIGIICQKRSDVIGVLIGGQLGREEAYLERLRRRAKRQVGDKIRFLGRIPVNDAHRYLSKFDCVMHLPASENCGGVVEPLAKGIPVVASRVGGLPEVVIDGVTGLLISANDPLAAARAAMETLDRPREAQEMAMRGKRLVEVMFDIERVTEEVHEIYRYILGDRERPPRIFDSREHLGELVDQSYESFP